ncbi:MAG: hypothetical protein M3395_08815 [Chloroflexota bacterium]|nr:hypothetical protein [Chloroflexota bacterium]
MLRSALLTFRMHRFEVLITSALLALTAISAIVSYTHATGANPSDECWLQNWDFDDYGRRSPECIAVVEAFWSVQYQAGFVASPIAVLLPFVVGLLLGVPVVGREIEMRTATLAWSLSGDRRRWLLARLLPVLALAGIGLVIAAVLVAEMARAAHPWNYQGPGRIPSLTEIGSEGAPLVGRGVMALGIAVLAGAVIGRTLPAFAVSAVLSFVFLFAGAPVVQTVVGSQFAVWQGLPYGDEMYETGPHLYTGQYREEYRHRDGRIIDEQTLWDSSEELCGCSGEEFIAWLEENITRFELVVPIEAYGVFEATETALTSGIGTVALLLTFPVVARRRPD